MVGNNGLLNWYMTKDHIGSRRGEVQAALPRGRAGVELLDSTPERVQEPDSVAEELRRGMVQ